MSQSCSSVRKESTSNAGDARSIPGLGRSPVKEIAMHSSTLAWRIPRTDVSGRLHLQGRKSQAQLSD